MIPRTELGRKLLEIRERAIAHGYTLLSEEEIADLGAVDTWKLEAERLAELVEAQRQVIVALLEQCVRRSMKYIYQAIEASNTICCDEAAVFRLISGPDFAQVVLQCSGCRKVGTYRHDAEDGFVLEVGEPVGVLKMVSLTAERSDPQAATASPPPADSC